MQLPSGPEGQAQLEELVELGAGLLPHSAYPWLGATRPSLLSLSWGPPARPTHVWAEGVRAARCAQAQQPAPGKDAGWRGHSHGQATSESCFSHPDTSPSTNRAPSRVYQNKRPNSGQCPGDRTAWAGRLQPGLPSHVTLLFREALEHALFWVPKALMLPEGPRQGSKLTRVPKSPPEGGQWVYHSAIDCPPLPGQAGC